MLKWKLQTWNTITAKVDLVRKVKWKLTDSLQYQNGFTHESIQYYKSMKEQCATQCWTIMWNEREFVQNNCERREVARTEALLPTHPSEDYNMQKLIPHWGHIPQPRYSYNLHEILYHLFGIVDHIEMIVHASVHVLPNKQYKWGKNHCVVQNGWDSWVFLETWDNICACVLTEWLIDNANDDVSHIRLLAFVDKAHCCILCIFVCLHQPAYGW